MPLTIKPKQDCRWDLVALGEVDAALRSGRQAGGHARSFDVYEGGGEYNVARGLKRCFGLDTAIVTAFADNPVGRLLQDLIFQGGVDQSLVRWAPFDGVGRAVRNGLNFTERGFGARAALGCSDRGHTAVSQLQPGQIDWDAIFGRQRRPLVPHRRHFLRPFESTARRGHRGHRAARRHGVVVSYDLNYRASLWQAIGGMQEGARGQPAHRAAGGRDDRQRRGLFGGRSASRFPESTRALPISKWPRFRQMIEQVLHEFPLRRGRHHAAQRRHRDAQRLGRPSVTPTASFTRPAPARPGDLRPRGRGDSFASGLIYGFLTGQPPQWARGVRRRPMARWR